MATKELRVCDVCEITRPVASMLAVQPFCVSVSRRMDDLTEDQEVFNSGEVDLCPKCVARLKKFVGRGVRPPGTKGDTDACTRSTAE